MRDRVGLNMDKSWLTAPRSTVKYDVGVTKFIKFAVAKSGQSRTILCPCKSCGNRYWLCENQVHEHLICEGFMYGYTTWIFHGEIPGGPEPTNESDEDCEEYADTDEMSRMLTNGFGMYNRRNIGIDEESDSDDEEDGDAYTRLPLIDHVEDSQIVVGSKITDSETKKSYKQIKSELAMLNQVKVEKLKENNAEQDHLQKVQAKRKQTVEQSKSKKIKVPWNKATEVHGRVAHMGSAQAHCIPWPSENVTQTDVSAGHAEIISHMDAHLRKYSNPRSTVDHSNSQTGHDKTAKKRRLSNATIKKGATQKNWQAMDSSSTDGVKAKVKTKERFQ